MRRWLLLTASAVALIGSSFVVLASLAGAERSLEADPRSNRPQGSHSISVKPWGPDQAAIDDTKRRLIKHPALQPHLKGGRYRMLSFEFVDSGVKTVRPEPPTRYRATFFNYFTNRAVIASGRFNDAGLEVSAASEQPVPSPEEFEAAVSILSNDPTLGPSIKEGRLQAYPPMPPLADQDVSVSKVERTVTVGLLPKDGSGENEVVGVNMIRESVTRYEGGAPTTSSATALNCGVSGAGQSTTSNGTAGQFVVVISRGDEEIWQFLCIRPSASSGNNKSGIELRNVMYRGKLVLARANAPILNVQYYRNSGQGGCGPFRDWSWQEGMFSAIGTDVPGTNGGMRICTQEPKTVVENGTDSGNYRGVAIYDREEVTLVSELNAGWYRYISKWIFHDDGIISPRFGFGATTNSCVCIGHVHHVYWRFDFDVVTAANNSVAEDNQGALTMIATESMRPRLSVDQFWEVRGAGTEAVMIKSGRLDGNYDKYGRGDLWLLRSNFPLEIDDSGQPGGGTEAKLNPMVNGESISNQDIVVWYGAHWTHDHFDVSSAAVSLKHSDGPFTCGPDLVLQKY